LRAVAFVLRQTLFGSLAQPAVLDMWAARWQNAGVLTSK
jgi:hypothetical protein